LENVSKNKGKETGKRSGMRRRLRRRFEMVKNASKMRYKVQKLMKNIENSRK
jgi:hypothetical protein